MASKHSQTSEDVTPPGAENFKRISGIGPAIESRLHSAGILTYAQLAATSPDDVAALLTDLAGLSAERIAKQDWLGQAQELAAATPAHEEAAYESHQHYETFAVELLLDEGNDVRRTRVVHVQNGSEESWAGWEEERLANFIVAHAALSQPPAAPTAPAAPSAAPVLSTVDQAIEITGTDVTRTAGVPAPAPATGLAGGVGLRKLETVPAGTEDPRTVLRDGQPFNVRLTLDLTDVAAPQDALLDYTATIYAKNLGGPRRAVGEARGTLPRTDSVTIDVGRSILRRGLYRLEAAVVLTVLQADPMARPGIRALLEGGLLQVY